MVHFSGYVDKLSGSSSYSTYYYLLRGSTLFWFKRRSDPTHTGSLLLRDCSFDTTKHSGGFVIRSKDKDLILKAANDSQRDAWINALCSANAYASGPIGLVIGNTCKNSTTIKKRRRSRSSPTSSDHVMLSPHRIVTYQPLTVSAPNIETKELDVDVREKIGRRKNVPARMILSADV
mmetsp:Transcript_40069/g.85579  ORF Transcript_40069/g.85579 Transcript_40069/m.85579 type:complete len:177 (-) Transcript_40069:34-564(-)